MVVVMNDDRVSDVEAYLPYAKAFAQDAVEHDKGLISMEVLTDPAQVLLSRSICRIWGSISSRRRIRS